jgi:hypothetical protein
MLWVSNVYYGLEYRRFGARNNWFFPHCLNIKDVAAYNSRSRTMCYRFYCGSMYRSNRSIMFVSDSYLLCDRCLIVNKILAL